MFRRSHLLSVAVLAATAIPQAAHADDRLPRKLAQLSPADFAERVEARQKPDASTVVLSTQQAYKRTRKVKGALADDIHLRAAIDRRSGEVSWQVWHDFAFADSQRDLVSVDYVAAQGLRSSEPVIVERRLDRCPPTDGLGNCGYALRVAFELPERTVRAIAVSHEPGARTPWPFQFREAAGRHIVSGIAPAEAAGLLRAVEAWKSAGRTPLPNEI